ncbi:MAG: hypothetical protein AAFQ82_11175 [Myxococcota bacterium]
MKPSFYHAERVALGAKISDSERAAVFENRELAEYVEQLNSERRVPPWAFEAVSPRPWTKWAVVFAPAAFAAAALMLALQPAPTYDGTKGGAPGVALFVESDGRVEVWDGSSLGAGDRFRIQVDPELGDFVAVFSEHATDGSSLLYVGPTAERLLPKAWSVDGEAREEVIRLSFGPDEQTALSRRARTLRIVLPTK